MAQVTLLDYFIPEIKTPIQGWIQDKLKEYLPQSRLQLQRLCFYCKKVVSKDKPAGISTHSFVIGGSMIFTYISAMSIRILRLG